MPGKIGMISPTTHAIAEFAIPTPVSGPAGITAGPDGNLWFTESYTNKIGTISPDIGCRHGVPHPDAQQLFVGHHGRS